MCCFCPSLRKRDRVRLAASLRRRVEPRIYRRVHPCVDACVDPTHLPARVHACIYPCIYACVATGRRSHEEYSGLDHFGVEIEAERSKVLRILRATQRGTREY